MVSAIVGGGVGAAAALAAVMLPASASATAGLTPLPQQPPSISFQSGGQYDGLFDARSGWISGLENHTWWFTMTASGGVGQCVFGFELDGVPQGWTPSAPICASNPFSGFVNAA